MTNEVNLAAVDVLTKLEFIPEKQSEDTPDKTLISEEFIKSAMANAKDGIAELHQRLAALDHRHKKKTIHL